MDTTHPPVEVLLTDGFDQGRVCPMEQIMLIHRFPSVALRHLLSLPEHAILKEIHVRLAGWQIFYFYPLDRAKLAVSHRLDGSLIFIYRGVAIFSCNIFL